MIQVGTLQDSGVPMEGYYKYNVDIPLTATITVKADTESEAVERIKRMRLHDLLAQSVWLTGEYTLALDSTWAKAINKSDAEKRKRLRQEYKTAIYKLKKVDLNSYTPENAFKKIANIITKNYTLASFTKLLPLFTAFISIPELDTRVEQLRKQEGVEAVIMFLGQIQFLANAYAMDEETNRPRNIRLSDVENLRSKIIKVLEEEINV